MKRSLGVMSAAAAAVFAAPAIAATPEEQQIALAGQRGVQIVVKRDGWYRVTGAALAKAGFRISNPAALRLYTEGKQVPIKASRAGIEFYGQALDTLEADERMYWLVHGAGTALRVAVVRAAPTSRAPVGSFTQTVEKRDRKLYLASLLNGPEPNFFGSSLYPGRPYNLKLRLAHVDPVGGAGELAVSIQGFSKVERHSVRIQVNGTTIGSAEGSGQEHWTTTLSMPAGVLESGVNTFTFTSFGGELDVNFLDTIRLRYPHQYLAEADSLAIPVRPGQRVSVGGFKRQRIRAFDVTRPEAVRELAVAPGKRRASGYSVGFVAPAGARRLLLTADRAVSAPASVASNRRSSLHSATQGADLVVISHRNFIPALTPLVSLRRQQGLKVTVVDVQDVYDEFQFGHHSGEAVRAFLRWAKEHWRPAPRYLLLVGDASSDPRNYLGEDADYVPTRVVDTNYTEAPSDDGLADFDDDGVPEMAVGRLPVRTPAAATTVVGKIVSYERRAVKEPRDMLLVSDKQVDYDFEAASRSLFGVIPDGVSVNMINRRDGPNDAAVRRRVIEALNRGPSVVNFFGHGSVAIWTAGPILETSDVKMLTNRNSLSLYLMMTCLNGYFIGPTNEGSLGEALVTAPQGGAVAVWASSGETVPGDQILADQKALGRLLSDPDTTLGDAMLLGKSSIHDVDVRRTWILLGDPLTRLH